MDMTRCSFAPTSLRGNQNTSSSIYADVINMMVRDGKLSLLKIGLLIFTQVTVRCKKIPVLQQTLSTKIERIDVIVFHKQARCDALECESQKSENIKMLYFSLNPKWLGLEQNIWWLWAKHSRLLVAILPSLNYLVTLSGFVCRICLWLICWSAMKISFDTTSSQLQNISTCIKRACLG